MRKVCRRLVSSVLVTVMALAMGACAGGIDLSGGPTISIGVTSQVPGVGFNHEGKYSGFDVDVARYVANKLGYSDKQIIFTNVDADARVKALQGNKVDFIVSSLPSDDVETSGKYSTVGQKAYKDFEFAGPTLISRQGFLVDSSRRSAFSAAHGLDASRICTVKGSGDEQWAAEVGLNTTIRQYSGYGQCMTALMAGEVDAISGEEASLDGLTTLAPSGKLSLLKTRGNRIEHGVWTKAGTERLSQKIADIISSMLSDGTWKDAINRLGKATGYRPDAKLNPPNAHRA